jgi:hypothetical protein
VLERRHDLRQACVFYAMLVFPAEPHAKSIPPHPLPWSKRQTGRFRRLPSMSQSNLRVCPHCGDAMVVFERLTSTDP